MLLLTVRHAKTPPPELTGKGVFFMNAILIGIVSFATVTLFAVGCGTDTSSVKGTQGPGIQTQVPAPKDPKTPVPAPAPKDHGAQTEVPAPKDHGPETQVPPTKQQN